MEENTENTNSTNNTNNSTKVSAVGSDGYIGGDGWGRGFSEGSGKARDFGANESFGYGYWNSTGEPGKTDDYSWVDKEAGIEGGIVSEENDKYDFRSEVDNDPGTLALGAVSDDYDDDDEYKKARGISRSLENIAKANAASGNQYAEISHDDVLDAFREVPMPEGNVRDTMIDKEDSTIGKKSGKGDYPDYPDYPDYGDMPDMPEMTMPDMPPMTPKTDYPNAKDLPTKMIMGTKTPDDILAVDNEPTEEPKAEASPDEINKIREWYKDKEAPTEPTTEPASVLNKMANGAAKWFEGIFKETDYGKSIAKMDELLKQYANTNATPTDIANEISAKMTETAAKISQDDSLNEIEKARELARASVGSAVETIKQVVNGTKVGSGIKAGIQAIKVALGTIAFVFNWPIQLTAAGIKQFLRDHATDIGDFPIESIFDYIDAVEKQSDTRTSGRLTSRYDPNDTTSNAGQSYNKGLTKTYSDQEVKRFMRTAMNQPHIRKFVLSIKK